MFKPTRSAVKLSSHPKAPTWQVPSHQRSTVILSKSNSKARKARLRNELPSWSWLAFTCHSKDEHISLFCLDLFHSHPDPSTHRTRLMSPLRPQAILDKLYSLNATWKRTLTSKLARAVYTAFFFFGLVFVFLSWQGHGRSAPIESAPASENKPEEPQLQYDPTNGVPREKGRLHLLVPATSSNIDFCKLLLSAHILGWPTPILINFGATEDADPYVQHLAKVEGILKYLEQQHDTSPDTEDLVLIIDGYDIWFQLRPEILIKRYYESNRAAHKRYVEQYGEDLVKEHDIRQSVIFGPDKLCWPIDFSRPACWAVPPGTLPPYAFGPQTSSEHEDLAQPRWLNSGTILGPTQDLIDIFRATLDAIHNHWVTNSDQFYFAELYGLQEYTRLSRKPELLEERKKETYAITVEDKNDTFVRAEPPQPENGVTEYHIGIDYESSMFQTLAFWRFFLTWTRAQDSWWPPQDPHDMLPYPSYNSSPYDVRLPADLMESRLPFDALRYGLGDPDIEQGVTETPWTNVELLRNTISRQLPVLLHFAGSGAEKRFRLVWWTKLWFQSHAEKLRKLGTKITTKQISDKPIEGMMWEAAEPEEAQDVANAGKGGAWSDRGGWFSWNRLCKEWEEELYAPTKDFDHLKYVPPEESAPEEPKPEEPPPPPPSDEPVPEEPKPEEPAR